MNIWSFYHNWRPSKAVEVIDHLVNALFHFFTTIFCQFLSYYSSVPHCTPKKFKSSIAIPSPIKMLKFQPICPIGGRAIGCDIRQTGRKAAKIINFCQFFSCYSRIPRPPPMNFVSFLAIPSLYQILKFQPNWPTDGQAIGRAIRQTRRKMAKIIIFCQVFRCYSRIPRRAPTKFVSFIATPLPYKILKFQPNWPTGSRAIGRGMRPLLPF